MSREIDHNSSVPLHAQLEQVLRQMIREPKYQGGECLPDELTLARQFSVSRSTVREAIKRLVFEGLVERRRGVGTRVKPILVTTSQVHWPSFTRDMTAQGLTVQEFRRELSTREADEEVARALQIAPGTEVTYLEGLRGVEDEPVVVYRSWFHPRLGDLGGLDLGKPLYEALAESTQVAAARSDETVSAVAAEGQMVEQLHVKAGAPLLRRQRIVRDAGGQPIEFAVNHYVADRFSYKIMIQRRDDGRGWNPAPVEPASTNG